MERKIFLITALVLIVTAAPFVGESFAVEQKYIDLMDSYVKNVTDQIMDTEGIAISNYVSYINETLTN
jgi:hypothetical protein